jgi:SAM-dependent methyltransferase
VRQLLTKWLYPPPRPQNPFDRRYEKLANDFCPILDLGAGRGLLQHNSPGVVIGVDPNRAVAANRAVDAAACASGDALPFADNTFGLCIMRWVVEHLPHPVAVFAEVARVLRPGGHVLLMTSNLRHYAYRIAALIPNRWHPLIMRWLYDQPESDTFPTLYRANTPRLLRRALEGVGLTAVRVTGFQDGPGYLNFSWPTYLMGALYDKTVNATDRLMAWRQVLVAEAEKRQ